MLVAVCLNDYDISLYIVEKLEQTWSMSSVVVPEFKHKEREHKNIQAEEKLLDRNTNDMIMHEMNEPSKTCNLRNEVSIAVELPSAGLKLKVVDEFFR